MRIYPQDPSKMTRLINGLLEIPMDFLSFHSLRSIKMTHWYVF